MRIQLSRLLACLPAVMACNLPAATLYVDLNSTNPVSPYAVWATAATNIQDAVDAASAGDFIAVSNGIYNTGGRVVFGSETNRVVVDKAVTIQSVNGPATTVIAGTSGHSFPPLGSRCVYLTNGAMLAGFTLTNGATRNSGDVVQELSGGGAWCADGSVVLSNCVFAGNSATQCGGGAFRGTLINCLLTNNGGGFGGGAASNTLLNCTLINNSATYQNFNSGGGAYFCVLSNCLVVGNSCNGGRGGGGAYFSTLTACIVSNNVDVGGNGGGVCMGLVSNCLISSNKAAFYGGGACSNTLINCVLENNVASHNGGGVYHSGLLNCTLVSNSASITGGGVFSGTLANCLLAGNSASNGGAVSADTLGPPTVLNNCTIYSNSASVQGGGLLSAGAAADSFLFATNCIAFANTAATGSNYYFAFAGKMTFNFCSIAPLPANGVGNIGGNPQLVNPAGGDFHLQANSPCINSGNNSYVATNTDLDGNPRIAGGTVDMGAYEFQSPASIISYAWLQQYGLPTDGSADYADTDGDGMNNWQEWRAGTDPTNPLSVLQILSATVTNNPSGIIVTWQSVSGVNYFIQSSADLSAQPAFSTLQTNLPGQAGSTSYTDTTATNNGPYFYRVGVQ